MIRNALLLLPALVFGLIYYFVPNVKVLVKDVWLGALITGLLWDAGFKGFAWFVRDVSQFTPHPRIDRDRDCVSHLDVFFRRHPALGCRVHGVLQQDAARHPGKWSPSECLIVWLPSAARTFCNTPTTRSSGTRGGRRRSTKRASSTARSFCRSATRRATGAT